MITVKAQATAATVNGKRDHFTGSIRIAIDERGVDKLFTFELQNAFDSRMDLLIMKDDQPFLTMKGGVDEQKVAALPAPEQAFMRTCPRVLLQAIERAKPIALEEKFGGPYSVLLEAAGLSLSGSTVPTVSTNFPISDSDLIPLLEACT